MFVLVCRQQRGGGCSKIGCGVQSFKLESSSLSEAIEEAKSLFYPTKTSDPVLTFDHIVVDWSNVIKSAYVAEIQYEFDAKKMTEQAIALRQKSEAQKTEDEERAELKRLQEKYGNSKLREQQ